MRALLEKRPGIEFNFSQPIKDRVEESISGIRGQVVVKIYGEDLGLLHEKLAEVKAFLRATRGARDVDIYRAGNALHLVADIDREAASRYGLPVSDIEDTIETAFGGHIATELWEGERKVGVRVRLPTPVGGDTYTLGRLEIPVGEARLPLSALAQIRVEHGRTQINREQGQRFLALKCNIEGRDMGSFVAEAQARVAKGRAPARGLPPDLGRRVREPAARHEAPTGHRAAVGAADLLPAVHDLPERAAGVRRAAGHPLRRGGRHLRALPHRTPSCRCRRRSASSRCSACR